MIIPEINIKLTFDKKVKKSELAVIRTSSDIAAVLREVFNKDTFEWTEEFILLCLNQRNAVVGFYKVSSGGITGTVADPRIILTVALNCCATKIILSHNHPSGNLQPSRADEELTQKIKMAARCLDITVIDHVIITDDSFYSFSDNGIL